jgi:hypothetical protein
MNLKIMNNAFALFLYYFDLYYMVSVQNIFTKSTKPGANPRRIGDIYV